MVRVNTPETDAHGEHFTNDMGEAAFVFICRAVALCESRIRG